MKKPALATAFFIVCTMMLTLPLFAQSEKKEAPSPKPLSSAEREVVRLSMHYLSSGDPGLWWDALAANSPLRELGREAALIEIELRIGPSEGSTWDLQTPLIEDPSIAAVRIEFPTGIDDFVTLHMIEQDGWKLYDVKSLIDPFDDPVAASASPALPAFHIPGPVPPLFLLAFLSGCLLLILFSMKMPARSRNLSLACLLVCTVGLAACGKDADGPATIEPTAPSADRGDLLDLRRALALGLPNDSLLPAVSDPIAALWRAQERLSVLRLDEADSLINSVGPVKIPLAKLLEARLAGLRDEPAKKLYNEFFNLLPTNLDGLRIELIQRLAAEEDLDEFKFQAIRVADQGPRQSLAFYYLSMAHFVDGEGTLAEEALKTGWLQEPLPRRMLFADALLARIAARPEVYTFLRCDEADEPDFSLSESEREPLLEMPEGLDLRVQGRRLVARIGESEMVISGGAVLAPPGTPTEDAVTQMEREADLLLQKMERDAATQPEIALSMLQPGRRAHLRNATYALSNQNRWDEIVRITDGITEETIPRAQPEVVRLRARALRHLERKTEASQLLIALAVNEKENLQSDEMTFFELGDLLAADGHFDVAIRVLERAYQMNSSAAIKTRLAQLRMEQQLEQSHSLLHSEHFELRFPPSTGASYPKQLALVLETEWKRLERWIPTPRDAKVSVDLFPLQQFMESYSQNVEVLGIFDGRVRVPLADLRSLHPILVEILTHELAHGMIAEATGDNAPRWFHEGLAQHVVMGQQGINPIPDLAKAGRLLAFPLIENVLEGLAEPQLVDIAYSESAWAMHFVEARWGVKGIHRLLDAFQEGLNTEQAIRQAFKMSLPEFEEAIWKWGIAQGSRTWTTAKLRRYDREFSAYMQRDQIVQNQALPDEPKQSHRPVRKEVSMKDRMHQWHAVYTQKTLPVRQALGPVITAYKTPGASMDNLGTHCRTLHDTLSTLLRDREALASPDQSARRYLIQTYEHFSQMAMACRRGQSTQARIALGKAEEGLRASAEKLRAYELQP